MDIPDQFLVEFERAGNGGWIRVTVPMARAVVSRFVGGIACSKDDAEPDLARFELEALAAIYEFAHIEPIARAVLEEEQFDDECIEFARIDGTVAEVAVGVARRRVRFAASPMPSEFADNRLRRAMRKVIDTARAKSAAEDARNAPPLPFAIVEPNLREAVNVVVRPEWVDGEWLFTLRHNHEIVLTATTRAGIIEAIKRWCIYRGMRHGFDFLMVVDLRLAVDTDANEGTGSDSADLFGG